MHPCLKWFLLPSLKLSPIPTMIQALNLLLKSSAVSPSTLPCPPWAIRTMTTMMCPRKQSTVPMATTPILRRAVLLLLVAEGTCALVVTNR
jgi:hypothetical protein